MDRYRDIPVSVAREIAAGYKKTMVVILAYDPVHELTHTTTYGVSPYEKVRAAEVGDQCAKAICGEGFNQRRNFEDFRCVNAANAAVLIDRLIAALRASSYALQSLKAIRTGMTDAAIDEVLTAISDAMAARLPGELSQESGATEEGERGH